MKKAIELVALGGILILMAGCADLQNLVNQTLGVPSEPAAVEQPAWETPSESPAEAVAEAQEYSGAFAAELSPYGRWASMENYGWVWSPYAEEIGSDWSPYAEAPWQYLAWGRYCYHYGWWDYSDEYGWFWLPGTDYISAPRWHARWGGGFIERREAYGDGGIRHPSGRVIERGKTHEYAPRRSEARGAVRGNENRGAEHGAVRGNENRGAEHRALTRGNENRGGEAKAVTRSGGSGTQATSKGNTQNAGKSSTTTKKTDKSKEDKKKK